MSPHRAFVLLAGTLALAPIVAGCRQAEPEVAAFEAAPAYFELAFPQMREIELRLEPLAPLPAVPDEREKPIVFVHLLDEPGSVVRTFDHPLPASWTPGRPIIWRVRVHQSALGEPLEPGEYLLTAGVHRGGHRVALRTAAERVARLEYRIATVSVPAGAEGGTVPLARFSADWLPPEAGFDRQILARRALAAGAIGTLQFGPVERAGRILLGVLIPESAGPAARLEILDGASQPKVRIGSTCGGGQPEIAGTGRFDVELEVAPAAGARICEVTIAPNFRITSSESAQATSVRLEVLAWEPDEDGPAG